MNPHDWITIGSSLTGAAVVSIGSWFTLKGRVGDLENELAHVKADVKEHNAFSETIHQIDLKVATILEKVGGIERVVYREKVDKRTHA